jgi:mannose-6-phosphate isomerase-like protein (cupin superfamily)
MYANAGSAPTTQPVSAPARHGSELTFETLSAWPVEVRRHPHHATLLRVIAGRVRLTLDSVEQFLGAGDEAIIPAAMAHRLESVGGEARVVMGFRPPAAPANAA